MKSLRILISGTVQGSLYRKYLEEEGKKIGVRGFVRMKEDGKIEVVIEGIDEKVNAMLDLIKKGEKHVEIRNVEVIDIKYQGFSGFKLLKL